MLQTLPASCASRAPWTRVAALALLLHLLGVAAAVSGPAAPRADGGPVRRDTIHLLVPAPAQAPPQRRWSSALAPPPPMPRPPLAPYLDLGSPDFARPPMSPRALDLAGSTLPSSPRDSAASGGAQAGPGPWSAADVDEPPQLEADLNPHYPEGLRQAGVGGWVEVEYIVGADGRVLRRSLRTLASSHPAFLLSALNALYQARFRPARRGGQSVAVLVRQTIRFRIQ